MRDGEEKKNFLHRPSVWCVALKMTQKVTDVDADIQKNNNCLMFNKIIFSFFILLFITSSCANYKLNYAPSEKNWQSENELPSDEKPVYTVYLLGDAGNSPMGKIDPAVRLFQKHMAEAPDSSAAIVLGDNIYPKGLPPKGYKGRKVAEHRLNVQLDAFKDYNGQVIIIPGNHDWAGSVENVRRQEKYVEKYLNDKNAYFPENGCGGPSVIELSENIVVIAIDSQWWIEDWDNRPEINDDCPIRTRAELIEAFADAVTDYKGKNMIVALHHPLYSNGPHGGYTTFKKHIFPLTDLDPNFLIPMPVIGSMLNVVRGSTGTETDIAHPKYTDLKEALIEVVAKNDSVIFASGHEHNIQYFDIDNQHYIVSGAGSKQSPARGGNGSNFTYGHPGFAKLFYYKDGSVWIEFWVPEGTGETGKIVFRKKIKEALPDLEKNKPTYNEHVPRLDTVSASVYDPEERRKYSSTFWGKLNSDLFYTPVQAPALYLDTMRGGLTPIKRSGNFQTMSLRLQDKKGKLWTLRPLKKIPNRALPQGLNTDLTKSVLEHYFTSANPFGAFTLAPMLSAIDVYHTNPQLYYLPPQRALGKYNEDYSDKLYLLEERPDENWEELASFGNSKNIVGFNKMFEELREDKDAMIDQEMSLRARLFDMIVGDGDRSLDQWRWATIEQDTNIIYRPIPRDRDRVFSKHSGLITNLTALASPNFKSATDFDEKIKSVRWLNYKGRVFDSMFLTTLSWEDWEKQVKLIQSELTDNIITNSIKRLPTNIYEKIGKELIENIKARRDNLMTYAKEQYLIRSKEVEILGTDEQNLFEVIRQDSKRTQVKVWETNKDHSKKKKLHYERVFNHKETKEVHLYGLDKSDKFWIKGDVKEGIRVRVIGGEGDDVFIDESSVKGAWEMTKFYDSEAEDNQVTLGTEGKDRRTSRQEVNQYYRLQDKYNYTSPTFKAAYNQDDGLRIGFGFKSHRYPFKRTTIQSLKGYYAFATEAYSLNYEGDFKNALQNYGLYAKAKFRGPNSVHNFFGIGNDSELTTEDYDFNRVRYTSIGFYPALKKEFFEGNYYTLGLSAEGIQIENTSNRVIASDDIRISPDVFNWNVYTGFDAKLSFDFVDNALNPANGFKFKANVGVKSNIGDIGQTFGLLGTKLTFYHGWGYPRRLVFATRIGTDHRIGNYQFFQAATLGGGDKLRGYRQERFAGQTSFYHNTDLRLRIVTADTRYFPFSMGISAGFDYGRIWIKDFFEADRLHYSYGGSLWISPLDVLIVNVSFFKSVEDEQFRVQFGYDF